MIKHACTASDRHLTEYNSAKFYVRDGSSTFKDRGDLTDIEINIITRFIKVNYLDMYMDMEGLRRW